MVFNTDGCGTLCTIWHVTYLLKDLFRYVYIQLGSVWQLCLFISLGWASLSSWILIYRKWVIASLLLSKLRFFLRQSRWFYITMCTFDNVSGLWPLRFYFFEMTLLALDESSNCVSYLATRVFWLDIILLVCVLIGLLKLSLSKIHL